LGVPGQNDIWVLVSWLGIEYTIRRKVVASQSPGRGESCESMFACGSSVHQNVLCTKVLQARTNQLIVWFVQVHVSD
jgi:hypothetical protein